MKSTTLELSWAGDVATVRLNDPVKHNAITSKMADVFGRTLDQNEDHALALVVTGSGRNFTSGASLSGEMGGEGEDPETIDTGRVIERHITQLMSRLRIAPLKKHDSGFTKW